VNCPTSSGKKQIGKCADVASGLGLELALWVRDGVRISNKVKGRVKLVNYRLTTALPIATSTFYPCRCPIVFCP